MIPKRGYFQPLDITGQIGWLWWFILFMAGIILWSETTFKLEMMPIVYLLFMLILGIITILRRRVYVAGAQLFWDAYLSQITKNFSYNDG